MPEEIEVPTEQLHEQMHEAAHEHGHEHGDDHGHAGGGGHGAAEKSSWIARVAVSSALLAVLAAVSALLASHHSDEAILEEMRASDQWAYYQSKSIKASMLDNDIDARKDEGRPVPPEKLAKQAAYTKEMDDIQGEAKKLDDSSEDHMTHHVWLARGVTAFQIAIAMGAIAVLAKRPQLWLVSLVIGGAGIAGLIMGLVT